MSPSNSFNGLEMWYLSENYLCSVFFWSFHVSVNLKKSLGNTLKKKILKQHIFTCSKYTFEAFEFMYLIVKLLKSNMKDTSDLKIICPLCSSEVIYSEGMFTR